MDHYHYEPLSACVRILAASPGTIQERLRSAWSVFERLNENDFPPSQWLEFQKVIIILSKTSPESLSDDEACKLAGIIYDLGCKMTESWYASIWLSLSH